MAVVTQRDLLVVRWIGEQYAVPVDVFGELLARFVPADAGTRASRFGKGEPSRAATLGTRERLGRRHVGRLETLDLLQRFRLRSGVWVAPTRSGLYRAGLAWETWEISDWQLGHIEAVARLRLHLEREYPDAEWISERAIRSHWHGKGARVRLADGGLSWPEDGATGVECERHVKKLDRYQGAVADCDPRWSEVWWFTPAAQVALLALKLAEAGGSDRHQVYELPEGGDPVTPRPPAGRAGPPSAFPLFLVAFLLSPLTLVAWVGGAALLRATGWPRWRLAAAAVVGGAFVVIIEGGPTAALSAHFRGLNGLLSQFGAPGVHLPLPGSFLWRQIPLSVPAGMLAATITRPGVALDGPDHTAKVRAARRDAAERRKARTIAARPPTTRTPASVLGVSLGGDLQSWQSGRYVVLPDYAARLPRLVLGRPGQGKSVYLCREAFLAGVAHRQAIVLDGKGDREFAAAVVDAYEAGWRLTEPGSCPTVHLFPDEPLSVWTGTPAEQVNMLLGTWAWSLESQWYKEVCVLALRLACAQPGQGVAGMRELVTRLDPAALGRAWSGHQLETGLLRGGLKDDLPGVHVRLTNLAAAAGGLLDGTRAIGAADLTVISLPTMANRGDSESIFRILMADIARWAARKGQRPPWSWWTSSQPSTAP